MIQFNKQPGQKVLELGGGDNPHSQSDIRVDIRPGQFTNFVADFNEPLPISSDEFDAVVAQYVIEHLSWRKVKQFISEIYRVLKAGGKAVITTANTEAQFEWIKSNPDGWDNQNIFESASQIIFASQDYEHNYHKNFMSPEIATKLFSEAGFKDIQTGAYGERNTDLSIIATKPTEKAMGTYVKSKAFIRLGEGNQILESDNIDGPWTPIPIKAEEQVKNKVSLVEKPALDFVNKQNTPGFGSVETVPPEQLFDRVYFNGGEKVGGYAREGYWDYPIHSVTARHIMLRNPESVLELGAARGYVLKRLQDAGIKAVGMEVSKHCILTRVCNKIYEQDICNDGKFVELAGSIGGGESLKKFDLCYSIATLEHIPEKHLPSVIKEMQRTCKRGLHGIDFGERDDGFDKTHVSLHERAWWQQMFATHAPQWPVEIVDKQELESGHFAEALLTGDGRNKLNIGCGLNMFHYGWLNVDIDDLSALASYNGYKFQRMDVKQALSHFPTGQVDLIFCSNFLQYLSYSEARKFFKECRRLLKKDGLMRLIVPDFDLLTNRYRDGNFAEFSELNETLSNKANHTEALHSMLEYTNSFWDGSLASYLSEAGFVNHPSGFRESLSKQMLAETIDTLPNYGYFMEATCE